MLAGADPVLGAVRFLGEATMTGAQTVGVGSGLTDVTDLVLTVRSRGGRLLIMWTGPVTLESTSAEAEGLVQIKVNGSDAVLSDQEIKATVEGSVTVLPFGSTSGIALATTAYIPPGYGNFTENGDSASRAILVVPFAGTVSRLFVQAENSTTTAATAVTVRKNATDTALTCSLAAGVDTGSDTAHDFTVAAGDYLSVEVEVASGGAGSIEQIAASVVLQRSDGMNTIVSLPSTATWLYPANPGKYILQAAVNPSGASAAIVSADCTLVVFELLPEARG